MTPAEAPNSLPLPPGNFGLPVLGETLGFLRDAQFAQKRHQRYGPIFKTRLFGKPTIFLKGATANCFIFTHENQNFSVSWPLSTKALLGPLSLALQTGTEHQKRRKLLAQAFMPRALSGYIPAMVAMTRRYLERWEKQRTLTWYPELRQYTFDVACKLLVGLDAGSRTRLGHLFEVWCDGLFALPLPLPWTKFGRAQRCRKQMLTLIEELIRERQQSAESGEDALGLLLQARDEDGNCLSIAELKDQILLLLFAGHETLTSAIASFCLQITQHPDVLKKLRAEQQWFPVDAPPSLEQLKQMTYLEQVLKEVLRFTPPVGGGFREVLATCSFEGYQIPKGWNVLYQINQTHKDRNEYSQPDHFDPERFQPERFNKQDKHSYVPFGGGIRECLGKEFARLEMKIFATHLIRDYEWSLLPDQDLELVTVPTPRPRDYLRVDFRRRQPVEAA